MSHTLKASLGFAVLPLYFAATVWIGWQARRRGSSAKSFLNATHSLSLPIVTAAYLAANCGALEIVGLSAMAAQYGVQAFHFYWIGAIPAMIFLALWMMPIYRRSGVSSLPEYLELRFGRDLRLVNTGVLGVTMILLAGISLYAMAQVLQIMVGWSFSSGVLISGGIVLAYALVGGIRATIYNEVFQLVVMLAGLIPLALRCARIQSGSMLHQGGQRDHLWTALPVASNISAFDTLGLVVGLGFILSFGYWCTDFVLMQRTFAVRTEQEARQVPLWAGFVKLAFSLIVVLPGLVAYRMLPELGHTRRFDQAMPMLMTTLYGPAMLGLGFTALAASLMSGLAANVSAFAALFTEDFYRARMRPFETDAHYLRIGRLSTLAAVILSALASYLNFFFSNLMEHVQLIFSVFGAPFWAVFLLGMGTRRTNERGAILGFLTGTALAILHLAAVAGHWLHYGSQMNANFHGAIYAFTAALAVGWLASTPEKPSAEPRAASLVFDWNVGRFQHGTRFLWTLSALLLLACIALNIVWK